MVRAENTRAGWWGWVGSGIMRGVGLMWAPWPTRTGGETRWREKEVGVKGALALLKAPTLGSVHGAVWSPDQHCHLGTH